MESFDLGGIIGAFMTGLFADQDINPAGFDGAFYGRPVQMWKQIAGILTAIGNVSSLSTKRNSTNCFSGFSAACTAGILLPLDWIIGIRLSPEEELLGLDWIGKKKNVFF